MILLIDAGNSRIKWACLVGGILQTGEPIAHSGKPGEVQLLSLAWAPLPRPQRIIAVNVLGDDFADMLSGWAEDSWGIDVEYVTAQRDACGVVNAYHNPGQLGADRWVALIAARSLGDGPACVIDCGTALTIDVMAAGGSHLGGLIIPGLALMRESLVRRTAGVRIEPETARDGETPLFAKDTAGGVIGGSLYAVAAVIDRVADDVRAVMETDVDCLLTGGDAQLVLPLLSGRYDVEPELVLKGLAVIAGDRE